MPKPVGSYTYKLRALTSLARYIPVYIGLMLSTAFSLSVLRDSADTGAAAYRAGSELLGLYGGFVAIVLPFVLLATARLRRGRSEPILKAKLRDDGLELLLLGRRRKRTVVLENRRVKGGFVARGEDGRVRLDLELEGGPTDGDRIAIELSEAAAEPIQQRFLTGAPEFDLSRSGLRAGALIWASALVLGSAAAWALMAKLEAAVASYPHGAPADVSTTSWLLGLTVTAVGLFGALGNLAIAPTKVVVGVDGLRIEGLFRKRFVAASSLLAVERAWFGVRLRTAGGSIAILSPSVDQGQVDALVAVTDERRSQASQGRSKLPRLEPGPLRDAVTRWRAAILGRVDVATYRESSISGGHLVDALADPAVPPEGRVAAALALSESGDHDAKTNIRLAARNLADERTRAILEGLADEEADAAALDVRLARMSQRQL